jgi:SdpI/YhfL family protein
MIVPAVFFHCGFGLLLAAFSLPLVLRRVPMNRAYGIRIPEAFTSEAHWYDINAYGGRLFLGYGILLAALGFLARDLAPPAASLWSPVFIVGPILVALALLPFIRSYARSRIQQGP